MKPNPYHRHHPNTQLLSLTLKVSCAAAALALSQSAMAADSVYTWTGGALPDPTWTTTGNWQAGSVAPTGGTPSNTMLVVLNSNSNGLVYTSAQGYTDYADTNSSDCGIKIAGTPAGGTGSLTITGGTLSSLGSTSSDLLANCNNISYPSATSSGTLTIAGGTYIAGVGLYVGSNDPDATGVININSGSAIIPTLKLMAATGNGALGAIVNLNGGTLSVGNFSTYGSQTATFNFNGGTLQATGNNTSYLQIGSTAGGSGTGNAYVLSGGAVIDSNSYNIAIAQPLLKSTASPGGGLTKNGLGTLTLNNTSAASTFTGATTVNAGTLVVSGSLAGTTNVTINSAATLQLGGANYINSAATLSLNGGTLDVNGKTQSLGTLTLGGGANSTLLLGGSNASLTLADSTAQTWNGTLTISNWSASSFDSTGNSHLYFTGADLTAGELADIDFLNPTIGGVTQNGLFTATLDGNEVVADSIMVPEPSTWVSCLEGLGALLFLRRCFRQQAI